MLEAILWCGFSSSKTLKVNRYAFDDYNLDIVVIENMNNQSRIGIIERLIVKIIFIYFLANILFSFLLGFSKKGITVDEFINKGYEFNEFRNKRFLLRGSNENRAVVFYWNYGSSKFYKVYIDNSTNKVSEITRLDWRNWRRLDTVRADTEDIGKSVLNFHRLRICCLSVDSNTNVYINMYDDENHDLVRFSSLKYYNPTYDDWTNVTGTWYKKVDPP